VVLASSVTGVRPETIGVAARPWCATGRDAADQADRPQVGGMRSRIGLTVRDGGTSRRPPPGPGYSQDAASYEILDVPGSMPSPVQEISTSPVSIFGDRVTIMLDRVRPRFRCRISLSPDDVDTASDSGISLVLVADTTSTTPSPVHRVSTETLRRRDGSAAARMDIAK
jgi:hypothetical protein